MYIHGGFSGQDGSVVLVHVLTGANERELSDFESGIEASALRCAEDVLELGSESGVVLSARAASTECCTEGLMDVLQTESLTLCLLTERFLGELFCVNCREAPVLVTREREGVSGVVFAGFVAPQTYAQPYNSALDTLELNCVDMLSALQYSKYRRCGTSGRGWQTLKSVAGVRSMRELVEEALGEVCRPLKVLASLAGVDVSAMGEVVWDGSKKLGGVACQDAAGLHELLPLGESADAVWTDAEVVEEVLRWLNLHVCQEGGRFWIYDWRSVTGSGSGAVKVETAHVADCNGQLTVPEVWNEIRVTSEVTAMDGLMDDPLSEDGLLGVYGKYVRYCTELWADGVGNNARNGLWMMVRGLSPTYDGTGKRDWMMQIVRHPQWELRDTLNDADVAAGTGQCAALHRLTSWTDRVHAMFVRMGSVESDGVVKDDSPVTSLELTPYMVITVNGVDGGTVAASSPKEAELQAAAPVAVYRSRTAGGVLSPTDDSYVNYIQISGSMILNPRMDVSAPFNALYPCQNSGAFGAVLGEWNGAVPSRESEDGRYYTRKYWTEDGEADMSVGGGEGFYGFSGDGPEELEFEYSGVGDGTDRLSKLPVLQCMLIIGGKCVVETGSSGRPDDFEWREYRTLEECGGDVDVYYGQSFSIGVNPKIGDKIVGTKWDIQDNFDWTLGLEDAKGTLIPIRMADRVSGSVEFRILGPVNMTWDVIARRHKTWFRSEQWTSATVSVLGKLHSILVEGMEMKLLSSAAGGESDELVYVSDTDERYVNVNDEVTMRVTSGLTRAEAEEHGVSPVAGVSTPVRLSDGSAVTEIEDAGSGETGKAEMLYVSQYYGMCHEPKIELELNVTDNGGLTDRRRLFRMGELAGKVFFVTGVSRDLVAGTAVLKLREA